MQYLQARYHRKNKSFETFRKRRWGASSAPKRHSKQSRNSFQNVTASKDFLVTGKKKQLAAFLCLLLFLSDSHQPVHYKLSPLKMYSGDAYSPLPISASTSIQYMFQSKTNNSVQQIFQMFVKNIILTT